MFTFRLLTICSILWFTFASCSNGNKTPITNEPLQSDFPNTSEISSKITNRNVLAVYNAMIDIKAGTFTVTPIDRELAYHFPLTQIYPNVLQIVDYGWTSNFWADIKLTHPLPGSGINAFDPRVIAIIPANPGVRFYYPIFNCIGNNLVVMEPDGYTKLFDNLGGSIPGNTNPFKAYFKDQPNRVWSSTGVTSETQRWNLKLSGFGSPIQFKLVVDVSTNYPNPPQPIVDNAPEPVRIESFIERDLTIDGGDSIIEVTLLDWQGASDIRCKIESPDLFTSAIQLFYSRPGPNPNEYVFSGTITNSLFAPVGEYNVLIAAWDIPMNVHLFSETTATVVDSIPANGNLIWAKRAGGTSEDCGFGITTLLDNSIAIIGMFDQGATFGLGETNETLLLSVGGYEIFIASYYPDGTLAWAKRAGGTYHDKGFGITTLSDNSTVVTGYFYGSATFGQGEGNETLLVSAGSFDIFVASFNPDGTLAWAKRAGGNGFDEGRGITTLSDDSIIVSGLFSGSATFGPGEPNQTVLTSFGESDIFIVRYNQSGMLLWAKRAGGAGYYENGYSIKTLLDNSVVVIGQFHSTVVFGLDEINQTILTSAGSADIFIARYNQDGTLSWAKRAGGSSDDEGFDITTLSDNSPVATGYFKFSAIFGPGESNQTNLTSNGNQDVFIARYNPNGTLTWAKSAGGSGYYGDFGYGITKLSDNATVVTGKFGGTATFGQGEPNQTVLTCDGRGDIFIARYNTDGTLSWAKRAGGSLANFEDKGYGIITLSDNSTIVTGEFRGSATFGPGEINQTILSSAGSSDIFIARFKQ